MSFKFQIIKAEAKDLDKLILFINHLELDNRNLIYNEFIIAKHLNEIIGFGRIRKHFGSDELASLGVLEPYRNLGVADALTKELIGISSQPLFLVCILPEYFLKRGFKITETYPEALLNKLNYCISELVVPEKYVVMKYHRN